MRFKTTPSRPRRRKFTIEKPFSPGCGHFNRRVTMKRLLMSIAVVGTALAFAGGASAAQTNMFG
ncbi:MAG: hypothetical protein L0H29_03990, partial [Sinobacteraceae bacterium]|nr:hypothetical protein [Nevskiaceae bacterium]